MLTRVIVALSVTMILFGCVFWPQIESYNRTGRFSPINIVASLQSPAPVKYWTPDGLLLEDGRALQLPGFRSLPRESASLAQIVRRGVEIGTNGRIYGLVKVHRWCGNDPVRLHLARVDIADMLLFLREGEPLVPIAGTELEAYAARTPGGSFSEHGWRVGEYMQFTSWLSLKDSPLEPVPAE